MKKPAGVVTDDSQLSLAYILKIANNLVDFNLAILIQVFHKEVPTNPAIL